MNLKSYWQNLSTDIHKEQLYLYTKNVEGIRQDGDWFVLPMSYQNKIYAFAKFTQTNYQLVYNAGSLWEMSALQRGAGDNHIIVNHPLLALRWQEYGTVVMPACMGRFSVTKPHILIGRAENYKDIAKLYMFAHRHGDLIYQVEIDD